MVQASDGGYAVISVLMPRELAPCGIEETRHAIPRSAIQRGVARRGIVISLRARESFRRGICQVRGRGRIAPADNSNVGIDDEIRAP